MNVIDLRKIVSALLEKSEEFDSVFPLGNVVYVKKGGLEYEVIIRTVRPGWNDRQTKHGPVAQE